MAELIGEMIADHGTRGRDQHDPEGSEPFGDPGGRAARTSSSLGARKTKASTIAERKIAGYSQALLSRLAISGMVIVNQPKARPLPRGGCRAAPSQSDP